MNEEMTQKMQVTKAIFPVAGLGTRFLPATKANPKEMLPIVDKPLIQYAVEEAVQAGINQLIFITSNRKQAIEDHFDSNVELETILLKRGQHVLLDVVRSVLPEHVSCAYVRQKAPAGLGDAILCARSLVGDTPFAVLLADDLIDARPKSCLQQMMEIFTHKQASIIAIQSLASVNIKKYGIVDIADQKQRLASIQHIIEKPMPEYAPSNLGVVGRYILTPGIFSLLEKQSRCAGMAELQLTDAISALLQCEPVYAYQFLGKRYDCGNKLGYLEATIEYALKHPELANPFRQLLMSQLTVESVMV